MSIDEKVREIVEARGLKYMPSKGDKVTVKISNGLYEAEPVKLIYEVCISDPLGRWEEDKK